MMKNQSIWLRSMLFQTIIAKAFICLMAIVSQAAAAAPLERMAFGSCAKQDKPQPIWDAVVATKPELFLFLGDNIYGDTQEMSLLQKQWDLLGAQEGFQRLEATCPILATWDDHDMGANDAGAEYPQKRQSQQLFLDFFKIPKESSRRVREGVYHAEIFGPPGKQVQVILLDTRFHRSLLKKGFVQGEPGEGIRGPYAPNEDPGVTVLGETQWSWLAEQLAAPAQLRIIGSSFQMLPIQVGWECWNNFPNERKRLLSLLEQKRSSGVVFISGDRHTAEIMRLPSDATENRIGYPIYEVTSSSLNEPSGNFTGTGVRFINEINPFRVGLNYAETNFGLITIDWSKPSAVVRLQVRDQKGNVVLQQKIFLDDLKQVEGVPPK